MKSIPLIIGPTAGGKSGLTERVADRSGAEIISVDSMKVYRSMDIGTAKPSIELRARIPHHLVNIRNPDESYSSADFFRDCCECIDELQAAGRPMILEGGTAQYVQALVHGLFEGPEADWELRNQLEEKAEASGDPSWLHKQLNAVDSETAARLHPNDHRRILRALEVQALTGQAISRLQREETRPAPYAFRLIGLQWPREELYERINQRVDDMFAAGLIDETRQLNESYTFSRQAAQAIGYKEVLAHMAGEYDLDRCVELVKRNTRRFAKHQLTWYRGWDGIHWLPASGKSMEELAEEYEQAMGA